ncbi:uncharacterized protein G2W53_019414 [Senna tora]|uniref:Uncharacterized protein n=1 Tax=Senna tora TaxID=362788 RepID=A0A834TXW5_9FABA|nr:uncharacterized protein G2W53_019414 [Senna tora]
MDSLLFFPLSEGLVLESKCRMVLDIGLLELGLFLIGWVYYYSFVWGRNVLARSLISDDLILFRIYKGKWAVAAAVVLPKKLN